MNGNVTLIELSDSLSMVDRNEKQLVAAVNSFFSSSNKTILRLLRFSSKKMFDRETRRTRLLESRSRQKHEAISRKITEISQEKLIEDLQQTTQLYWTRINHEKSLLQEYFQQFDDQFNSTNT